MTRNGISPKIALAGQMTRWARVNPLANDQGLTLIECLVAIIMVALVASAIAPALVISVATRVQSQKAEQALTLAQAEVDRVRVLAEQNTLANVASANTAFFVPVAPDSVGENAASTQVGPLRAAPVARAALNSPTQTFIVSTPVDTSNSNPSNGNEFAVQIYRTKGISRSGEPVAFALGVRVYDASAVEGGGGGNLSTVPLSLGISGGEGRRSERPLASLYTTVAVAEQSDSFCDLLRFTESAAGVTASAPLGCTP